MRRHTGRQQRQRARRGMKKRARKRRWKKMETDSAAAGSGWAAAGSGWAPSCSGLPAAAPHRTPQHSIAPIRGAQRPREERFMHIIASLKRARTREGERVPMAFKIQKRDDVSPMLSALVVVVNLRDRQSVFLERLHQRRAGGAAYRRARCLRRGRVRTAPARWRAWRERRHWRRWRAGPRQRTAEWCPTTTAENR